MNSQQFELEELFEKLAEAAPELAEEVSSVIEKRSAAYRLWHQQGKGQRLRNSLTLIIQHFASTRGSDQLPEDLYKIGAERADQGLPLEAIPMSWLYLSHHVWRWIVDHTGPLSQAEMTGLWSKFQNYVTHSVGIIQDSYIQERSEAYADEVTLMRATLDRLVTNGTAEEAEQALSDLGHQGKQLRILMCRHADPGTDLITDRDSGFQGLLFYLKPRLHNRPLWSVWRDRPYVLLPSTLPVTEVQQAVIQAGSGLRAVLSGSVSTRTQLGEQMNTLEPLLRLSNDQQPFVDFDELGLTRIVASHVNPSLPLTVMPQWLQRFFEGDAEHHRKWSETACVLLDANTNVGEAASMLYVHHNTIYYRLETMERYCGVDIRNPKRLADIRLALNVWEDPWAVAERV